MLPHLTHYGITAEQFKSLNAHTMRCIINNNKKADATIKKTKRIQKPHSVSLVAEWNPSIYIHNKI